MTKYVKTDYVPEEVDYLTADKVYEVVEDCLNGGWIRDDKNDRQYAFFEKSSHLDNRPWTVWEE